MSLVVGLSQQDPKLAPASILRTYSPAGVQGAPRQGERPEIFSFKEYDQAAVTSAVRAMPAGTRVVYFHEPEDDFQRGSLRLVDWKANVKALCKTVRDTGRLGQVFPGVIIMGWSLMHRQDVVSQMFSNDVVVALRLAGGFVGYDRYANNEGSPDGLPHQTPVQVFGPCAGHAAKLGLPWSICETGVAWTSGTDDAKLANWWTAAFAFLRTPQAGQLQFVMGWNPASMNDGVYALSHGPKTAALWSQMLTTYQMRA